MNHRLTTFPRSLSLLVVLSTAIWVLIIVFSSPTLWAKLSAGEILIGAIIVLAATLAITNPAGGFASPGVLTYAIAFLLPPSSALFIGGLAFGIGNGMSRGWVPWRVAYNCAQMGLSLFLASGAFRLLGGDLIAFEANRLVVAAFAAAVIHRLSNNLFVSLFISQARKISFLRTWLRFSSDFLVENFMSLPTALLFSLFYAKVGLASLVIFLPLPILQRMAISLYFDRRASYLRIIDRLVYAVELSIPYAGGHARRVADLSLAVAEEVGLSASETEMLEYAALLHDVGMIAFEEGIESGSLPADWLSEHARLGATIADELGRPRISEMIRNHHWPQSAKSIRPDQENPPSLAALILALAEYVDSRAHSLPPYDRTSNLEPIEDYLEREGRRIFGDRVVSAALRILSREETIA